jgi:mitochondrial enoyl-[acyl-carrier protein] reductase / trans-2-enoyl-CoA reductase
MSGEASVISPEAFIFRDLTLRGFWLVHWFRQTPEQQRRALVNEVASLIIAGTLHAPVHATYGVTEIKQAVAAAASGGRSGKILIVPRR